MAISETAQKNHEELFPNHKSTLKVTDPELIEVFDNFAFDEVLRHGNLDARTRLIMDSRYSPVSPSKPESVPASSHSEPLSPVRTG